MIDQYPGGGRAHHAPTFSILTATFNAGSLLDQTIACLRAQTCKDFQWIVIDGASSDESLVRINHASDIVDQCISEPDRGIADAWNKGLSHARGTHVLILNAGDTYDPSFLETMSRHCDGHRIICSHARLVSQDGREIGVFRAQPHKLGRAMHVPHNWCAVPLHYYRTLGPYLEMPLAMDFEWFHRYYRRFGAAGFHVVDQVLGTYHLGGRSDASYADSFKVNERILVTNGSSPLMARAYRLSYSLKHAIRRWTVQQK